MTATDPEVRIRYLSFGLFAQKLIDVLIEFVEQGKDEKLNDRLTEAIGYLKEVSGSGQGQLRGFRNYEQVRTLEDVCGTPQGRQQILQMLDDLLHRRGSKRQQRKNANKAIEFFYALENRALRNFDKPEPMPRGIHELCRA